MPGHSPITILQQVFGYPAFRGQQQAIIDTVVGGGLGMFGAPATVASQLVALHEMGIDHVMFLQNFGVLDSKLVHDSMRRIAGEVMPEVHRRIG